MRSLKILVPLCGVFASLWAHAAPVTKIELSHRLEEVRAERLDALIDKFNKQQGDVHVSLVRRAESDMPRQLNLVTSEEYERFLARKARFKPLYEVMRDAKQPLDSSKIAPDLRGAQGQLFSLPLAFATPVLYYNKAAFRKAGLNPDAPPSTWAATQEAAGKVRNAGYSCGFTTSWPAWIMIDNFSAWHGASISDGRNNFNFNGLLQIKYIAMMTTWYKSTYFSYFGRRDEADSRFASGECAMLTSSSDLATTLSEQKNLEFGVAPLPFYDDEITSPKNTLAAGASLWVAGGLKPAETAAVAKFVNYVLDPETQIQLTIAGGFLPLTSVARAAAESSLLKDDTAAQRVAMRELRNRSVVPSLRVVQNERVRLVVEEELEAVWADKKPAKQALDDAVQRGNVLLRSAAAPSSRAPSKAKPAKK